MFQYPIISYFYFYRAKVATPPLFDLIFVTVLNTLIKFVYNNNIFTFVGDSLKI